MNVSKLRKSYKLNPKLNFRLLVIKVMINLEKCNAKNKIEAIKEHNILQFLWCLVLLILSMKIPIIAPIGKSMIKPQINNINIPSASKPLVSKYM